MESFDSKPVLFDNPERNISDLIRTFGDFANKRPRTTTRLPEILGLPGAGIETPKPGSTYSITEFRRRRRR